MTSYSDYTAAIRRARQARDDARDALYKLQLQRLTLDRAQQRAARGEATADPGLVAANTKALETQRGVLGQRSSDVVSAIGSLYGDQTPQDLIAKWDDSLPILLLPVRVETRWKTDLPAGAPPQLWVRVYPDDVAITTHEQVLTSAEVDGGQGYWTALRGVGSDPSAQKAAWTALADRFGGNRAAWVALQTRPLNWAAALADPTLALQFPDPGPTKPDAWTIAPHTRVLPDRFVLLAWRGDVLRYTEIGNPIDDIVVLGPAPSDDPGGDSSITRDTTDKTLTFGDAFAWVRDFDRAVNAGLGFRVDVTSDDVTAGFDRLLVLGLKASSDAPDAQALLEQLIDDHHYSREGFALLQQGTPTNNTDGGASGYSRRADDEHGVAESTPPRFVPDDDRSVASDGQRLADFLGLSYTPLLYASGADHVDNAEAVAMNRSLYAGTLGYYLDHMLNEVVADNWLAALRQHFTDQVTGRGPISAIRIGNQPYGILPTSSLARWKPSLMSRDGHTTALGGVVDPFESTLLRVLTRFDQAWSTVVPEVVQVASAGNGAANLLEVLGLQPTSAEFHQRVGYSYDYLKNLEAFAWGGSSYADVLKMMMEGMGARILLGQLGYTTQRADGTPKAYPLLLQLIWRHYQTALDPKQLIDGQPLSETALIKPYDAGTSKTYIDWLLANAANAVALQAQDFGGPAPPNALLYLMLYFSVVMEAARGVRDWLTSRNVTSEELVRSRKFLNIGTQPSPSVWEVFRAPANRVAVGDPATASLLQVVNAPQSAANAGQSVQEQRAAITALRQLPTARLERALVEHIDTLSYRLDAWETSLFSRRLFRQRQMNAATPQRRTGVYLGSYGYLENLRPNPGRRQAVADRTVPAAARTGTGNLYTEQGNGGYVHAPSLNHATAAALLRNGYLTHASSADPTALAVNLSSGRVQRASHLLEGIRNGQTLEALLGIQFERGLHDWTTRSTNPVILDQLVPLFRTQFPILLTKVPQATDANNGASQVAVDYQVVNGLTLALTTDPFPYGITDLSTLSTEQQTAIQTEKAALADTLDALRDVLTAESAYQLALGNFDRAAAVLQSAGNGTIPPDVQVLATPRGTGIAFTQRLAMHLTTAAVNNPWPGIPLGERAKLEPAINAWLGDLLGAPDEIRCTVAALAADGSVLVVGGNPVQATISLADLGIQPIDFVYIVRNQTEPSGAAELETRIRYTFARQNHVTDDVVVRIKFADAGAGSNVRSFAEMLPLADRLRRLLGTARSLDGRHYRSASKDSPAAPDNPGAIDVTELRTRVGARLTAVRALVPPLAAAATTVRAGATNANVDALRAALMALANAGVNYAVPRSAVGVDAARVQSLLDQADALVSRLTALGTATDDQLANADAATRAEQKLSILSDAIKAWMGSDVLLLPHFVFPDSGAVSQADGARDQLLDYVHNTLDIPLPVEEWLHGAACVRPLVHDFEMIRLLADTIRDEPLLLSAIQLPFRTGDSWLGAQFPPTMQVVHDTISVVQHLPQGFDATAAQCGLLIDEWVESIPTRAEVTGMAFNFNAPNSAPPQSLLLAVTPDETGHWQWDDLVDSVLDTFRRARLRAVEPDMLGDLPGIGTLLPAVVAEFGTSAASVSLDYSFTITAIAEPVIAMMTPSA